MKMVFKLLNKLSLWRWKLLHVYFSWLVTRKCRSYQKPLYVGGRSWVNNNTHLGKNVSMNGLTILGYGEVRIGDNFHSGPECIMISSNHNYKGSKLPYDETHIEKKITIEDNVWLGARVTILGGVTIGEGAIIQAGAVVTRSIEPYGIAGGNPAQVFKLRDKEHYDSLKAQNLFH